MDEISLFPCHIKANEVPGIIVSLASFGKLKTINSYFIKGERERDLQNGLTNSSHF